MARDDVLVEGSMFRVRFHSVVCKNYSCIVHTKAPGQYLFETSLANNSLGGRVVFVISCFAAWCVRIDM